MLEFVATLTAEITSTVFAILFPGKGASKRYRLVACTAWTLIAVAILVGIVIERS